MISPANIIFRFGPGPRLFKRLVTYLALVSYATACTTLQPLPVSDLPDGVRMGDAVQIVRSDGEMVDIMVSEISETGIVGGDRLIEFTDIREIRVQKVDAGKTSWWALGITASIVLAAVLIDSGCTRTGDSCPNTN